MQQHQVGKKVDKPEHSYVGKSLRSFFLNKIKHIFMYRPADSLEKSTQK